MPIRAMPVIVLLSDWATPFTNIILSGILCLWVLLQDVNFEPAVLRFIWCTWVLCLWRGICLHCEHYESFWRLSELEWLDIKHIPISGEEFVNTISHSEVSLNLNDWILSSPQTSPCSLDICLYLSNILQLSFAIWHNITILEKFKMSFFTTLYSSRGVGID